MKTIRLLLAAILLATIGRSADVSINSLPAISTVSTATVLPVVDVSGTPTTKKATVTQLINGLPVATGSTVGTMSASDKTKLDAATDSNTASAIVRRSAGGNFSAGTITATSVTGLSSPVNPTDAANKSYVDAASAGLSVKQAGRAATTGSNITLSGGAPSTLDGLTLVANDRILVKDQADNTQNGIYYVSTLGTGSNGTWTRTTDADTGAELTTGTYIFISSGTTNANAAYTMVTQGTITIGSSAIVWALFSQTTSIDASDITGQIIASQIQDAAINTAKFASGLTPVEILGTLPVSGNFAGRTVFLTTDSKLYRYNGSSFVASVPTVDLTGTITTAQIAALAVTAGKIAADAVAETNIVPLAVTAGKIAALAVAESNIQALAVTTGKIGDAAITSDKIVTNAVTADKIVANAVTAVKIATDAVTADKIIANAITAGKIATDAVTSDKILANAIVAGKIATDAVTSDKIFANAITAGKIATDAVTSDKIRANAITSAKITANAITTGLLAAGAVTATQIAADAVTAPAIAANAVTSDKIIANAITTGKLAVGAVTATEIATDAITSVKIAAGQITTDKIAANAITAAKIGAGEITAAKMTIATLSDISTNVGAVTGGTAGGWSLSSTKMSAASGASSVDLDAANVRIRAIRGSGLGASYVDMGTRDPGTGYESYLDFTFGINRNIGIKSTVSGGSITLGDGSSGYDRNTLSYSGITLKNSSNVTKFTLDSTTGSMTASGDFTLPSAATIQANSGSGISINSGANFSVQTGANMYVGGDVTFVTPGRLIMNSGSDMIVQSGADINLNSGSSIIATSGSNITVASGATLQGPGSIQLNADNAASFDIAAGENPTPGDFIGYLRVKINGTARLIPFYAVP